MGEMVERVAKAIHAVVQTYNPPIQGYGGPGWGAYVKEAEAAIAAMREPSVEMVGDAGARVLNQYVNADPADSYHGTATWAWECWQAMIDEALKP